MNDFSETTCITNTISNIVNCMKYENVDCNHRVIRNIASPCSRNVVIKVELVSKINDGHVMNCSIFKASMVQTSLCILLFNKFTSI